MTVFHVLLLKIPKICKRQRSCKYLVEVSLLWQLSMVMFKSKHFISTIIKIKLNYNIIDINIEFVQKHKKSFHHFR